MGVDIAAEFVGIEIHVLEDFSEDGVEALQLFFSQFHGDFEQGCLIHAFLFFFPIHEGHPPYRLPIKYVTLRYNAIHGLSIFFRFPWGLS